MIKDKRCIYYLFFIFYYLSRRFSDLGVLLCEVRAHVTLKVEVGKLVALL